MSKTKPTQPPTPPAATDLPEGWSLASLGDGLILDVQPGFACGTHNREGQGIGHLRPMNVSSEGDINLSNLEFVPNSKVDKEERLSAAAEYSATVRAMLMGLRGSHPAVESVLGP